MAGLVAADYGAPTTQKAVFPNTRCDGRPLYEAGAYTRAGGQPGGADRGKMAALAERGGNHRLEPALSLHFLKTRRKSGRNTAFPLSGHSGPHCAGWPGVDRVRGQVCKPQLGGGQPRRRVRGQENLDHRSRPLQQNMGMGVSPAMVPWTVTNTTNSTGHQSAQAIDTARTGGGGGANVFGASLIQNTTEQSEHVRGQITGPIMTIRRRQPLRPDGGGQPDQILRERPARPEHPGPLTRCPAKRPGGADKPSTWSK